MAPIRETETLETTIAAVRRFAVQLRRDVVSMVHFAGDGHIGTSLSIAELVAALYHAILKIDPARPRWEKRDRLVLSKGHSCPVLYAALARTGFFPVPELLNLRKINSILQGHPDAVKTPGIDATAGPLGHGISIGAGMAIAARLTRQNNFVYVITGDGELEEGLIWEGMMTAVKYRLGRLIVFVDNNGLQSGGTIEQVSGLAPIVPKFEAFGFHCQEIDGHNVEQIMEATRRAKLETDRPSCIVLHTIKAGGIPFMAGDNSWHKRVPSRDELERAVASLDAMEPGLEKIERFVQGEQSGKSGNGGSV